MHIHLLLVEDNLDLANTVIEYLEITGIVCDHASNGQTGLNLALSQHYDVILLDIMLPRLDGQQLCKQLREQGKQTPILMLTSLDALPDKLASFAMGADDYLVKPFEFGELWARVRAVIRRSQGRVVPLLTCRDIEVDVAKRSVTRAGERVSLSAYEYRVLLALMERPGHVVRRSRLESVVYADAGAIGSNTIAVYIHQLRRKLGDDVIVTVHGQGYSIGEAGA